MTQEELENMVVDVRLALTNLEKSHQETLTSTAKFIAILDRDLSNAFSEINKNRQYIQEMSRILMKQPLMAPGNTGGTQ